MIYVYTQTLFILTFILQRVWRIALSIMLRGGKLMHHHDTLFKAGIQAEMELFYH